MSRPNQPADRELHPVLGAGYLYFNPRVNGVLQGAKYLGESPAFSLSMSSETLEWYTSDGPVAELGASVATKVTRTGTLTLDSISDFALSLFSAGTITEELEALDSQDVTDVFPIAYQGCYYWLGAEDGGLGGGQIASVTSVTSKTGTPVVLTRNTDYVLDDLTGKLYLIPGKAAVNGENLEVKYKQKARSRTVVSTSDSGIIEGALTFEADNTRGENRSVYISDCSIVPDGDFAFKSRDTFQTMNFNLLINGGWKISTYFEDET